MGLDELHLRVLSTSSENEKERKDAIEGKESTQAGLWATSDHLSPVLKLLNKGRHWVLVVCGSVAPSLFLLTARYSRSYYLVTSYASHNAYSDCLN
jgi:hypothetical protein